MNGTRFLIALSISGVLLACAKPESSVADPEKKAPAGVAEIEPEQAPQATAAASTAAASASVDAAVADVTACQGVDTALTQARSTEYAQLVTSALKKKLKPSTIDISNFMESGSWSAVYASTPVSDPGVLFFNVVDGKKKYIDVWAGIAEEDDRPDLIKWAEGIGAPTSIANCFADTVIVAE